MRTWLFGLMLLAAPAGAEAQLGRVVFTGTAHYCDSLPFVGCTVGDMSCPVGETCHALSPGSGTCAPRDVLFCVPEGASVACPVGHHADELFGIDVCIPDGGTFCAAEVGDCFTSPLTSGGGGGEPVAYRAGDCDRDGLRNDADPAPCLRPTTIGLVDPSTGACDAAVTRVCASDADCSPDRPICAEVATVATERHRYCVSAEPPATCCGGFVGAECVNGATCDAEGADALGFCHPFCRALGWSFEMRLQCLRDPDDPTRFVGAGAGDCDGDGVVNGEEARAGGRDPCVAEDGGVPMPPDGGPVVEEDAGSTERRDAGSTAMDASAAPVPVPVQPRFEGGGGCRCRASGGAVAGSTAGSFAWLGIVGLALWRGRSRRAARRRSAGRRPSAR